MRFSVVNSVPALSLVSAPGSNVAEREPKAPPQTAGPSDQQVLAHLETRVKFDGEGDRYVNTPATVIHERWPDYNVQAFYRRMATRQACQWRTIGRHPYSFQRFYLLIEVDGEPMKVLDDDRRNSAATDAASATTPSMDEVRRAVATATAGYVDGVPRTLLLTNDERSVLQAIVYTTSPQESGGWDRRLLVSSPDWSRDPFWSIDRFRVGMGGLHRGLIEEAVGRFCEEGVLFRKDDAFALAVNPADLDGADLRGERPIFLVSRKTAKKTEQARKILAKAASAHDDRVIPATELPALYRRIAQAWGCTDRNVRMLLADGAYGLRAARSPLEMLRHRADGGAVLVSPSLGWCDLLVDDTDHPDVRDGRSVKVTTATAGYGNAARRIYARYRF